MVAKVMPRDGHTLTPTATACISYCVACVWRACGLCSAGEVLITKDAVSYFLGSDGKPSRKTTITWSQPPTALMATKLYVMAVLPAAVEVKSVSRLGAAAAEQVRGGCRANSISRQ